METVTHLQDNRKRMGRGILRWRLTEIAKTANLKRQSRGVSGKWLNRYKRYHMS
jgi:hypothetical protein